MIGDDEEVSFESIAHISRSRGRWTRVARGVRLVYAVPGHRNIA